MFLWQIKQGFCSVIQRLQYMPKTLFCLLFGRFLKVKKVEEIISLTAYRDFSSDDEDTSGKIATADIYSKETENPKEVNLHDADASSDLKKTIKPNENAFSAKPVDNEKKKEEISVAEEMNKGESNLKESSLSPQGNESVNIEQVEDQTYGIAKFSENEDDKKEHSGSTVSSNPTYSINQVDEQKYSGEPGRQTLPKSISFGNAFKTTKRTLSHETDRKQMIRNQKRKTDLRSYRAGIENHSNSCYLDSTLFALFYKEDIFDGRLLHGEDAKDTRNETSEEVTNHLNEIARRLREKNYCPSNYVTDLRKSMRHINERIVSSMMDVDELLSNLLGKALHLNPFIMYCTKQGTTTGNFYHQILINPNLQREKFGTVQELLEESMKMQHLTFNEPPTPALIIKMPRSNGRLVGHQQIIPNLHLDISNQLKDASNKTNPVYELNAVITLCALHYTVYVRRNSTGIGESTARWEYFNDLPPTIREVDSLDSFLTSISKKETNADYQKITRDIHVCIYNNPISL